MPTNVPPLLPAAAPGLTNGRFAWPDDFGWAPRLRVSRTGVGTFRLDDPVATLRPGAGAAAGGRVRTAFVDRLHGDDRGDGSARRPFRTIAAAWMLPAGDDHDTIEIVVVAASLPPSRILWGAEGQCVEYLTRVPRPANIILRASDDARFYVAACGLPQPPAHYDAPPVWRVASGTAGRDAVYTTPIDAGASPLAMPYDLSPAALRSNGGRPLPARRADDARDAAAHAGSAFVDAAAGVLHFRPFDDRDMTGDACVTKGSVGPGKGYAFNVSLGADAVFGKTVYFRKVSVIGGSGGIRGNDQSGGRARATIVFDDVEVFGQAENAIQANGAFDFYVVGGAYGGAAADALNLHAAGDNNAAVEAMQARIFAYGVDVTAPCGLAGDGRNNAATLHEWCLGAYVACRFANSDGRVVGFIDNGRGVLAGCTIGASAAADAGGFRTMASVSGAAVMDLYECTWLPQPPGAVSPAIRAEPHARMRLHGTTKAALRAAGLTLSGEEWIVEEDAGATLHPTAGPLRLYHHVAARGGVTRLYVRGVWPGASWTAAFAHRLNGTATQGRDDTGDYVDVETTLLAQPAPVLTLTHAPRGCVPWRFDVKLAVAARPDGAMADLAGRMFD